MEWLILIVLVPAVLIPVVLLYGFAGCTSFGASPATPEAPPTPPPIPHSLTATPVSTSEIDLTWQDNSSGGVEYVVSIHTAATGWNTSYRTTTVKTLRAAGLEEGKVYGFRVRARLNGVESAESNVVMVRTLHWVVAYEQPLDTAGNAFAGQCLVQRIDHATLSYPGVAKQVRITLRTQTQQPLMIDAVSLSHAAVAGESPLNPTPDRYDSDDSIIPLGPAMLPANGVPLTLPPMAMEVKKDRDLLVVFDISDGSNTATRRTAGPVGASEMWRKANTNGANDPNRENFTLVGNNVYLVEKIEMLVTG